MHVERTTEGKLAVHSLGKQDARPEPSTDLVRNNDSAHGRTNHDLHSGRLKTIGQGRTDQRRVLGMLEKPGALNVLRTMPT